jgi:hypothetical protein
MIPAQQKRASLFFVDAETSPSLIVNKLRQRIVFTIALSTRLPEGITAYICFTRHP